MTPPSGVFEARAGPTDPFTRLFFVGGIMCDQHQNARLAVPTTPSKRRNPPFGVGNSPAEPSPLPPRTQARGSFLTRCGYFVADAIDRHSCPEQADARRYVLNQRDPRYQPADRERQRCK